MKLTLVIVTHDIDEAIVLADQLSCCAATRATS